LSHFGSIFVFHSKKLSYQQNFDPSEERNLKQTEPQAKLCEPSQFWKTVYARGYLVPVFHWPNITLCGKYPCACVMPQGYFGFTCCRLLKSASTRKRKNFGPCACACACAYACVKAVFPMKKELLCLTLCLRR